MKQIVFLLLSYSLLVSCGREKSESITNETVEQEAKEVDVFSVVYEAKYDLDDSLVVFYQKEGHFQYDNPIALNVKGDSILQKFEIKFPEGVFIENIKLTPSTNKNQKTLQVKSIAIFHNNDTLVNGFDNKYYEFFFTDESFGWDEGNQRFNLNHNNKYPPSFTGNDKILEKL